MTQEVKTAALCIARLLIRLELKSKGVKANAVRAKDITRLANELLAAEPSIIRTAIRLVGGRHDIQA